MNKLATLIDRFKTWFVPKADIPDNVVNPIIDNIKRKKNIKIIHRPFSRYSDAHAYYAEYIDKKTKKKDKIIHVNKNSKHFKNNSILHELGHAKDPIGIPNINFQSYFNNKKITTEDWKRMLKGEQRANYQALKLLNNKYKYRFLKDLKNNNDIYIDHLKDSKSERGLINWFKYKNLPLYHSKGKL